MTARKHERWSESKFITQKFQFFNKKSSEMCFCFTLHFPVNNAQSCSVHNSTFLQS